MDHSLGDEATRLPDDGESLPDLGAGDVIDRYRVIRLLGRGGMGQVYEVEHVDLHTRHALKIIPSELAGQHGFVERFRREATVMAQLQHPGIVHVSDFAHSDGRYWLLMELVKGVPVPSAESESRLEGGAPSPPAVRRGRLEGPAPSDPRVPGGPALSRNIEGRQRGHKRRHALCGRTGRV